MAARLALGAGEQPSSHRARPDRAKGTTGVMYSAAAPGVLRQRVPVRWCCTVYNGPLCLCPICILHDSPERSGVDLARAVCLPPSQRDERCPPPFGSMVGRRSYRVAGAAVFSLLVGSAQRQAVA